MNTIDETVGGTASSTAGMSNTTSDTAQKIIELAQEKPKGILGEDIAQALPNLKPAQIATVINSLLSEGRLGVFQRGTALLYKLKDRTQAQTVKGADNEEKVVYNIIQEAGNKGIWIRKIRTESNLGQVQLAKVLKSLENKKFIKGVKSVEAGKKKLYMLYDVEPHKSVTGGAWYQDQDFEVEFVDILTQQCLRFFDDKKENAKNVKGGPISVRNATYATSEEVRKFVSNLGISKVELSVEDIEMILNTLIYDGKIQKTVSADNVYFRAIQPLVGSPGLIKTPCGVCPVMKNCCDLGDVTPSKCEYFKQWLDDST